MPEAAFTPVAIPRDNELFFLLEKYDPFQGIATGIATSQQLDRDNEILDYAKSKPYFEAWSASVHKDSGGKSFGNVRLQHDDKKVAGRLNQIDFDDENKVIRVEAKIVDPVAKELLQEGCLTGFSIGGRYVDKSTDKDGTVRYVADPCEISVVDRPALPEAVFQSVKSDGTVELKKFAKHQEPVAPPKEEAAKAIRYLVPDGEHLPVTDESGKPSHSHMGAAWAALHGGYRGNKYEGPDRDKAIAALTHMYHEEGMELPSTEKSISVRIDLADAIGMIKELDIQDSNEEILGLLKSLDQELEKKMGDENKDVLTLDKAARHSVHQKIQAAKAHMDAHLEHCVKAHKAMHAHLDGIAKVMGGGPESMHEDGEPNAATEGRGAGPTQVPGGSDTADKGVSFVEELDASGNPTGLFKRVEKDRPLTTGDLKELGKTVVKTMLQIQKAADDAIGDRAKVIPLKRAETREGAGEGNAEGEIEKMSPEDWKAYGNGDRNAIAKAQRCTKYKWQAEPSRLADPGRYRGGAPGPAGR